MRDREKEDGPGQNPEELQPHRSWPRRLRRKSQREETRELEAWRPRAECSKNRGRGQLSNAAEMSSKMKPEDLTVHVVFLMWMIFHGQ